ncbi:hypothetical protein J2S43_006978 [Catenuloplanes nepalensis]|uniref:Uncharacterized protein n=1 Tax=Catenuloplanes nepalensis TaxID=587533 RepID=A0ABT9N4W6_9ACTN|nr:hypothetical protein [Catenuloplanes nepalensis]
MMVPPTYRCRMALPAITRGNNTKVQGAAAPGKAFVRRPDYAFGTTT